MLLELARVLFGAEKSDFTGEIGILLGNCALLACYAEGKAPESARRFAELVASLCDAHPIASDTLLRPFMRILFQQPTNVHAVMWRKAVDLRCLAHRMEALDGAV